MNHGFRKITSASATRLSQGFYKKPNIGFFWDPWFSPPALSFARRAPHRFGGQAPHDYSWFGFFDVLNDGYFFVN